MSFEFKNEICIFELFIFISSFVPKFPDESDFSSESSEEIPPLRVKSERIDTQLIIKQRKENYGKIMIGEKYQVY